MATPDKNEVNGNRITGFLSMHFLYLSHSDEQNASTGEATRQPPDFFFSRRIDSFPPSLMRDDHQI